MGILSHAEANSGQNLFGLYVSAKNVLQVLSPDALRMRLTRLCQKRRKGACHVDDATHEEWRDGGERKEWLEMALVEVLKNVGTENTPGSFKKVKATQSTGLNRVFQHASIRNKFGSNIFLRRETLR